MQILRHYKDVPDALRGTAVALGNFDGVHRGHQEIIAKAMRLAQEFDAPSAVVSFEPHPRQVFKPDCEAFRLTPFRVKARLIEALGVEVLFALPFDLDFSRLSAEEFALDVLAKGLGLRYLVVGDNFRFGKNRTGDIDLLTALGRSNGFGVTSVPLITSKNDEAYSSTLVRHYLKNGNPTRAALLLGRYWEIEGQVEHGDQRGRTIGFPTANVALGETLHPAYGVYAVRAAIENGDEIEWRAGVANLGLRPTVAGTQPRLEVHLFDFSGDIYGRHIRVALVDHLRPEQKFADLEALKAQIEVDNRRAQATLRLEEWTDDWPASPFITHPQDSTPS